MEEVTPPPGMGVMAAMVGIRSGIVARGALAGRERPGRRAGGPAGHAARRAAVGQGARCGLPRLGLGAAARRRAAAGA